jgi:hypothetical protein
VAKESHVRAARVASRGKIDAASPNSAPSTQQAPHRHVRPTVAFDFLIDLTVDMLLAPAPADADAARTSGVPPLPSAPKGTAVMLTASGAPIPALGEQSY